MAAAGEEEAEPAEAPTILAEGLGLSSWMASPAELEAASMAAAGEPLPAKDNSQSLSWKRWAGRKGGDDEYQLGDATRGLLSGAAANLAANVRDAKHFAANAKISMKETLEQHARAQIGLLVKDKAAQEAEGALPETPAGRMAFTERWWYEACQAAHRSHDPQADAPKWHGGNGDTPPHRGHLDVCFVAADVQKVDSPLCQLSLEDCHSGALRPRETMLEDEDAGPNDEPRVSSVRFAVQEFAGCDLRVNVFDSGNAKFQLGFEDGAFCGGAFLPLSLLMEMGSRCTQHLPGDESKPVSIVWMADLKLNLLPLELLRLKRKLEPGKPGGVQQPKKELGSVRLAVKLVLHCNWQPVAAPVVLRTADPFLGTPRQQASFQNLSEPLTFVKEAGATLERVKRAFVFDQQVWLMDELRDSPAFAAVLHVWWLCLSLLAPLWAWPPLLAMLLPLYALGLRAKLSWPLGLEAPCLYDDPESKLERQESALNVKERMQTAIQDAAVAHTNLRGFFQNLSQLAATLEKVKFVLAAGDPYSSLVCMGVAFVAACGASVAIAVVGYFCSLGGLRLVLWLTGGYWLVPQRIRTPAVGEFMDRVREVQEKYAGGDQMSRMLAAFWERVPDFVEASHVQLCRQEVLLI